MWLPISIPVTQITKQKIIDCNYNSCTDIFLIDAALLHETGSYPVSALNPRIVITMECVPIYPGIRYPYIFDAVSYRTWNDS